MKLSKDHNAKQTQGMKAIIYGLIALFTITVTGILGYIVIEGYSVADAFFMTVITISTVGFQIIKPLSEAGQVFTSILIMFSFGTFGYVATTITKYIVDGIFKDYYNDNKVKKRIEKLNNHIIICGYGRNGRQAALDLINRKVDVIIVEEKEAVIDEIREDSSLLFVQGDATHDEVLNEAMIGKAKALITTLPNDADNLFVVLTAKQLNKELKVISRASTDHSDIKLKRAGANNVIMSDKVGGQRMAKLVSQPDIVEFLDYIMLQGINDVQLVEISCKNLASCFAGKSISEFDARNKTGASIIGIKRSDNSYVVNPNSDFILNSSDEIFALGTSQQLEKLKNLIEKD